MNILRLYNDAQDAETPFSLSITNPRKSTTFYVHLSSDDALRLAHRIMAVAHSGSVLNEVFEPTNG